MSLNGHGYMRYCWRKDIYKKCVKAVYIVCMKLNPEYNTCTMKVNICIYWLWDILSGFWKSCKKIVGNNTNIDFMPILVNQKKSWIYGHKHLLLWHVVVECYNELPWCKTSRIKKTLEIDIIKSRLKCLRVLRYLCNLCEICSIVLL